MKRALKISARALLIFFILVLVYAFYTYQTDTFVKALVQNNESALFYRPSTEMKSMEDLKYTEHRIEVEKSVSIYSYEFEPTSTPKAHIFLVRGNSGNISHYVNSITPLVSNGFHVYTLDWRGYGKSTGVPNFKGILKDTQAAFADFLSKTANDSMKTIVYGMSLGGQVAVKIAKDNQTSVDALILDGSLASAYGFIADNVEGSMLSMFLKDNENYNQEYIAVRDIAAIENMPKLIIHSTSDSAVPFERGKSIFDAAKAPKELWETNTVHIKTLEDLTKETIEKIDALIR